MNKLTTLLLLITLALGGCTLPIALPTPKECPCWDTIVNVYAWEDEDCDRNPDPEEPPLAGIMIDAYAAEEGSAIRTTTYTGKTDREGKWSSDGFIGSCGCDSTLIIEAKIPTKYKPTTDIKLVGISNEANFGFVGAGQCP